MADYAGFEQINWQSSHLAMKVGPRTEFEYCSSLVRGGEGGIIASHRFHY